LAARRAEGWSVERIRAELATSAPRVRASLAAAGLPTRLDGPTFPELYDRDWVREHVGEHGVTEVARQLGCSVRSVKDAARRHPRSASCASAGAARRCRLAASTAGDPPHIRRARQRARLLGEDGPPGGQRSRARRHRSPAPPVPAALRRRLATGHAGNAVAPRDRRAPGMLDRSGQGCATKARLSVDRGRRTFGYVPRLSATPAPPPLVVIGGCRGVRGRRRGRVERASRNRPGLSSRRAVLPDDRRCRRRRCAFARTCRTGSGGGRRLRAAVGGSGSRSSRERIARRRPFAELVSAEPAVQGHRVRRPPTDDR
jgi:hypothetical protein